MKIQYKILLLAVVFVFSSVGIAFSHAVYNYDNIPQIHKHYFNKVYYESQIDKNKGIVISKYNPGPLADTVEESEETDVWTFFTSSIGFSLSVINAGLGYNAMDRVKKTWTANCTVQPGTTCFVGLVEIWYRDYFSHHILWYPGTYSEQREDGLGIADKFNRFHYYSCEVQGEAVTAPNPCSGWNPNGGEYIEQARPHGHNHQDNT